jgi:hypothetical protein
MHFDALFAKIVATRTPCPGHAARRGMFFDFWPVTTSELSHGGLKAKMWRISGAGACRRRDLHQFKTNVANPRRC